MGWETTSKKKLYKYNLTTRKWMAMNVGIPVFYHGLELV